MARRRTSSNNPDASCHRSLPSFPHEPGHLGRSRPASVGNGLYAAGANCFRRCTNRASAERQGRRSLQLSLSKAAKIPSQTWPSWAQPPCVCRERPLCRWREVLSTLHRSRIGRTPEPAFPTGLVAKGGRAKLANCGALPSPFAAVHARRDRRRRVMQDICQLAWDSRRANGTQFVRGRGLEKPETPTRFARRADAAWLMPPCPPDSTTPVALPPSLHCRRWQTSFACIALVGRPVPPRVASNYSYLPGGSDTIPGSRAQMNSAA